MIHLGNGGERKLVMLSAPQSDSLLLVLPERLPRDPTCWKSRSHGNPSLLEKTPQIIGRVFLVRPNYYGQQSSRAHQKLYGPCIKKLVDGPQKTFCGTEIVQTQKVPY